MDWKLLIILIILLGFGFLVSYIITLNEETEMMKYIKQNVAEYITTNYMLKYTAIPIINPSAKYIIYFII